MQYMDNNHPLTSIHRRIRRSRMGSWAALALCLSLPYQANALPSFARQTGQACTACHIGAFGPQLTPYGQKFKIGGYTEKGGSDAGGPESLLSAMLVGTVEHTSKKLPDNAGPYDGKNDNLSLQEASVFAAGGVSEHFGGLAQATYSDIDRKTALDNVDLRYATTTTLAGKDTVFGLSLNNNPTVQDPWNTTPAWGFPYMTAELAPAPSGAPLIAGGLSHQVMGLTGYAFWDDNIYVELGAYRSQSLWMLQKTNVAQTSADVSQISGLSPYWRVAYTNSFNRQNFSAGLFGMNTDIHPGSTSGATDKYRDIGVDASYQFLGTRRHVFTLNSSLIHEKKTLDASLAAGDVGRSDNTTNALNLNGSYYFDNTYGVTLGYFNNFGSKEDTTAFTSNPLDGSRTGLTDTSGYILQADWSPFGKENSWGAPLANVRLGAQYTMYSRYNGSSTNYDGNGRDASDNDTLMLMIWTAF